MKRALIRNIVALSLLVCPAALADEPAYEIVLHRPTKVGARFTAVATGREVSHQRIISEGKVVEEEKKDFTIELTALFTVLEVDAKGRASKLMFSVEQSKLERDGTSEPLYTNGTVVVASVENGKDVFTVGGRRVPEEIDDALSLLVSLPSSEETDDDIFGTREKKRVGDSWPMNVKLALRSLGDAGIKVAEENISGGIKLKGVNRVGYDTFLDLESWMEMKDVEIPLPAGFRTDEAHFKVIAVERYPVAKQLDRIQELSKMTMSVKSTGRAEEGGPEFRLELTSEQTSKAKYTYR